MAMDRKEARANKRKAEHKFKKLDALHKVGAPAKEIRKLSDAWMKRHAIDPKAYWKAANAKPGMLREVAV